jgi:hypothetical protein
MSGWGLSGCDSGTGPVLGLMRVSSRTLGGCAGFLDSESRLTKLGTVSRTLTEDTYDISSYYVRLPRFVTPLDAVGLYTMFGSYGITSCYD